MDDIIKFILANFWIIFLISVLVSHKQSRLCGIALLSIQTIYGFIKWAYIVIVFIVMICNRKR